MTYLPKQFFNSGMYNTDFLLIFYSNRYILPHYKLFLKSIIVLGTLLNIISASGVDLEIKQSSSCLSDFHSFKALLIS